MELSIGIRILVLLVCGCVSGIESVDKLIVKSVYPESPLLVSWDHSSTSVEQYFLWAQDVAKNTCTVWLTLRCSDCPNMTTDERLYPDSVKGCTNISSGSTFSNNQNPISVTINNTLIQPYTEYEVFVSTNYTSLPNNTSSAKGQTGQYIATEVSITGTSSKFPDQPLLVNWTTPLKPNGVIVSYIIIVQRDDVTDKPCVSWWSINCSDCGDKTAGDKGRDIIIDTCTPVMSNGTFLIKDISLGTFSSAASIEAYRKYSVTVVPINGYGWGNKASKSILTGQSIATQVTITGISSKFPDQPLLVNWTTPLKPNGVIVSYVIIVQRDDVTDKPCVSWWSLNCSDCGDKTAGDKGLDIIINACTPVMSSGTFLIKDTSLSTLSSDASIEAYRRYLVTVVPINGYGWGNKASKSIRTGQSTASQVNIAGISSQFPDQSLVVNWTSPLKPNGVIVKYIIIVEREENGKIICVSWWSINCSDCSDTTAGDNGRNTNINSCKHISDGPTFLTKDTSLSTFTNDASIEPYRHYLVTVVPINGYGWGNRTTIRFLTAQYKSDAVRNVTIDNYFPKNNLVFYWLVPEATRGLIINYFVFVFDVTHGSCLLFVNNSCSDCRNSSRTGVQDAVNITCRDTIQGSEFSSTDSAISTNLTNPIIRPNNTYNVSIFPVNGYGWGARQTTIIQTKPYTPLAVSSFTSEVTGRNISLFWTAPPDDIYNFTYSLQISNELNITDRISTMLTNYTVLGSFWCQSFHFQIWTETPYGNGTPSSLRNQTDLAIVTVGRIDVVAKDRTFAVNWDYSGQSNCGVLFEIFCNESKYSTSSRHFLIGNLEYYSLYNITVVPFTIMNSTSKRRLGIGQSTIARSAIGLPGPIPEIKCSTVSFNEFKCAWKAPTKWNGPSSRYFISCKNDTPIQTGETTDLYYHITSQVVPDVRYTCSVQASNEVGYGPGASDSITIEASSTPKVINQEKIAEKMASGVAGTISTLSVTLPYSHFSESLGHIVRFSLVVVVKTKAEAINSTGKTYLECDKGKNCPYEIDVPYVVPKSRWKRDSNDRSEWTDKLYIIGQSKGCTAQDGYTCNGELTSNTEYEIAFRVYTNKGYGTYGFISKRTLYDSLAVSIAVPTVICLLLIIVVVGIIVYRRRRSQPAKRETIKFTDPIAKISDFGEYYKYVMEDSGARATQQFSDICIQWKELENSKKLVYFAGDEKKDRFRNIKPYAHNIVTLQGDNMYINASKICRNHHSVDITRQCRCDNGYIAAQGPIGTASTTKTQTIGDFWRMVLQYKAPIIVNLTKCVEAYKEKCAQYWPENVDEEETHITGDSTITVCLTKTTTNKSFDERELLVSMSGQQMRVTQLHFTAWPDHDCPNIGDFLALYNRFCAIRCEDNVTVVHCSAGVGRTGSFILIDIELRKAVSETNRIEIYNTLINLRSSRCFMVQIEKQYLFVHAVIYEYLRQNSLLTRNGSVKNRVESTYSYLNPAFD